MSDDECEPADEKMPLRLASQQQLTECAESLDECINVSTSVVGGAMTDNAAERLERNIQERTRSALIATMSIPFLVFWAEEIGMLFSAFVGRSADDILFTGTPGLNVLATASGLIIIVFASMSRTFALHRKFDHASFGLLRGISSHIRDELAAAAEASGFESNTVSKIKSGRHMELFYTMANRQTVLRGQAFLYWEQYFSTLQIFIFGLFSAISTLLISFSPFSNAIYAWSALLPAGLSIFAFIQIQCELKPKIWRHVRTQIDEMRHQTRSEFLEQIERRFG